METFHQISHREQAKVPSNKLPPGRTCFLLLTHELYTHTVRDALRIERKDIFLCMLFKVVELQRRQNARHVAVIEIY